MDIEIPPEAYNLGTPTAEYSTNPRSKKDVLLSGGAFILLGLVVPIIGLLVAKGKDTLQVVATGLPLIFIGGFAILNYMRHHDLRVLLYENGFSHTRSGKTEVARWDEVDKVWQDVTETYRGNVHTNTTHRYKVKLDDGRKYVFDEKLGKVAALGNALQKRCAEYMLPRAQEAYEAGEAVSFDKFSLSRAGISKGDKTLPWQEVESVEVRRGTLHIKKKGQDRDWAFAMVSKVPNPMVFMALAKQHGPSPVQGQLRSE